ARVPWWGPPPPPQAPPARGKAAGPRRAARTPPPPPSFWPPPQPPAIAVVVDVRGIDLEAEEHAGLRTVGILRTGVLRRRIHADARHGQCPSTSAHVELREIERIRAVEIDGLRVGAGGRVPVAGENGPSP